MEVADILVVEDDQAINDVVCRRLRKDGHSVEAAYSGTEARRILDGHAFDLIITDLMLPGLTGEQLVDALQCEPEPEGAVGHADAHTGAANTGAATAHARRPAIIVISAKDAPTDKVTLLTMGADDYLTKPFDLDELAARVQVQLRNRSRRAGETSAAPQEQVLQVGAWHIDPITHTFTAGGEAVALTPTEFRMVELLARNPKRIFTKQELYEYVWDEPYTGQETSVSAHVSNLRTKLKPSGTDTYIRTVWGIGFKCELPG